jgi:hypothetical protein
MESDGDHFLTYYLTKDDNAALNFKQTRSQYAPYEAPVNPEARSKYYIYWAFSRLFYVRRLHRSISCEITKQ